VHVKIQSHRCAISIADSTWCTFMDKLCGLYIYMLRLYLSLVYVFVPVLVCILYSFHSIEYIYGQPRSPRGCWPAGYLSGSVRDTLFSVRRSGRLGWWRHKSPTTLFRGVPREYRARWHGHVENISFFSPSRCPPLAINLFFEPLLLREIPLGTFSTSERELVCKL